MIINSCISFFEEGDGTMRAWPSVMSARGNHGQREDPYIKYAGGGGIYEAVNTRRMSMKEYCHFEKIYKAMTKTR